jgi:hypothetical protein
VASKSARRQSGGLQPPAQTQFVPSPYLQEDIVPIPVRNRVLAFGAAVAATLALWLAVPTAANAVPVNAAPPAGIVQPQANVVVPNEVGKNVGIAINDLLARGFGLGFRETRDNTCNRDEFEVVRQSPVAGSVVPAGTTVTLTFVVWPDICP